MALCPRRQTDREWLAVSALAGGQTRPYAIQRGRTHRVWDATAREVAGSPRRTTTRAPRRWRAAANSLSVSDVAVPAVRRVAVMAQERDPCPMCAYTGVARLPLPDSRKQKLYVSASVGASYA